MIRENTAALIVMSDAHGVERVTSTLGIAPTVVVAQGESLSKRNPSIVAKTHRWIYRVEQDEVPETDETGFGSMALLVELFMPVSEALATLRPDYRTVVEWGGFSDSTQGGFVIPSELLRGLAQLDCDLFGTAYLALADAEAG